jgi:hypothetical protein
MTATRTLTRPLALLLSALALPAGAHEFWLAPLDFSIRPDQTVQADIRVGQRFRGESFPASPRQAEAVSLHRGDTVRPLSPKRGDLPAISATPVGEGLNTLSLSSGLFTVTYGDKQEFDDFVRSEGMGWAVAEHERRELPATGFVEAYRRHAKSLIRVGHGRGDDRRTGLDLEWVMLTNPYTSDGDLVAQLWWRDEVAAHTQCRLFVRSQGDVKEHLLRTDRDGKVTLPHVAGGEYLLNAVRLIVPDDATAAETGAVWESRWASVTFATVGR